MKYIAFGTGKIFRAYCSCDIKKHIIAYIDNNFTDVNEFEGKPVIRSSQISRWNYDYIIIFSTTFFSEIYKQLVDELNVPEKKVISFWDITQENNYIALRKCGENILELIEKMQCSRILDFTAFFSVLYYNKIGVGIKNGAILDAFVPQLETIYPIFNNLYEHILYSGNCDFSEYDVVICPYILNGSKGMKEELPEIIRKNVRYLLIILPYKCDSAPQYGNIIYTEYKAYGKFLIIDTKYGKLKKNIKIYTVSHKEFKMPQESIYEPIYVGKYGAEKEFMQSDRRGDNIARYNPFINETTALYWIWKHSKEDYIGICHYRRFFLQDKERSISNILSKPFVDAILEKYDIILPQTSLLGKIRDQLKGDVNSEAFEKGWEIITCLIKEKQPYYWDAFEYFFYRSKSMYPCNMFVARKEVIDRYCEWLFSFILDAVEAFDFRVYDSYSQRMIGFFVERLFNVWLLKQNLKIKELPILLVDEL